MSLSPYLYTLRLVENLVDLIADWNTTLQVQSVDMFWSWNE